MLEVAGDELDEIVGELDRRGERVKVEKAEELGDDDIEVVADADADASADDDSVAVTVAVALLDAFAVGLREAPVASAVSDSRLLCDDEGEAVSEAESEKVADSISVVVKVGVALADGDTVLVSVPKMEADVVRHIVGDAETDAVLTRDGDAIPVREGVGSVRSVGDTEADPLTLPDALTLRETGPLELGLRLCDGEHEADGDADGEARAVLEPLLVDETRGLRLPVAVALTLGEISALLDSVPVPDAMNVLRGLTVPVSENLADADCRVELDDVNVDKKKLAEELGEGEPLPDAETLADSDTDDDEHGEDDAVADDLVDRVRAAVAVAVPEVRIVYVTGDGGTLWLSVAVKDERASDMAAEYDSVTDAVSADGATLEDATCESDSIDCSDPVGAGDCEFASAAVSCDEEEADDDAELDPVAR